MDEAFRILDDGRVFFDYGPASMVVTARRGDENLSDLAASAFPFLRDSLSEIAGALPILRQYPDGMDYSELTGLPRVMAESVKWGEKGARINSISAKLDGSPRISISHCIN